MEKHVGRSPNDIRSPVSPSYPNPQPKSSSAHAAFVAAPGGFTQCSPRAPPPAPCGSAPFWAKGAVPTTTAVASLAGKSWNSWGNHGEEEQGRFKRGTLGDKHASLANQTTRNKWMFPQTAISYVKDFNCHIGTTICFWLFGFPGVASTYKFRLNGILIIPSFMVTAAPPFPARKRSTQNSLQLRPDQLLHGFGCQKTQRLQLLLLHQRSGCAQRAEDFTWT